MTCIQHQSLHHCFERCDIPAAGRAWWHDLDDQALLWRGSRVLVVDALLSKAHHDGVALPSPSCSRCLTGVLGASYPLVFGTSVSVGFWYVQVTSRATLRMD